KAIRASPTFGSFSKKRAYRSTRSTTLPERTVLHLAQDRSRARLQAPKDAAEAATAGVGSAAAAIDVRAGGVERQRRDVGAEIRPNPILAQVLFDVREIEHDHRSPAFFHVLTDGANGLRAAKVSDDGNQQIARLEGLEKC